LRIFSATMDRGNSSMPRKKGETIGEGWSRHDNYKDTGCHIHDDRLTCPLDVCIYDTGKPGPKPKIAKSKGE